MINAIIPKAAPPKELTLAEEVVARLDRQDVIKYCEKFYPRWQVCQRGFERAFKRNDEKLRKMYISEMDDMFRQAQAEMADGVIKNWEKGEGLEEVFMKKRESKGKRIKTNKFALNIFLDVLHSILLDTESIYRSEGIDWDANQRENNHPVFSKAHELKAYMEDHRSDDERTIEDDWYEDESDKIYEFIMKRAGIYYRKLEKLKQSKQN